MPELITVISAASRLIGYASTCQPVNCTGWMIGLVNEMNATAKAVGIRQRYQIAENGSIAEINERAESARDVR